MCVGVVGGGSLGKKKSIGKGAEAWKSWRRRRSEGLRGTGKRWKGREGNEEQVNKGHALNSRVKRLNVFQRPRDLHGGAGLGLETREETEPWGGQELG